MEKSNCANLHNPPRRAEVNASERCARDDRTVFCVTEVLVSDGGANESRNERVSFRGNENSDEVRSSEANEEAGEDEGGCGVRSRHQLASH